MNFKIYQINYKRDKNRVKFMGYTNLKQFQKTKNIDASIYDEVFRGNVNCSDLEDVFRKFNTDGHPLYRGHSLSVSDIVVVDGDVPNLAGRIRFFNSPYAFEECYYTDEEKFRKDIHEAYEVGRTIKVEELSNQNITTVECGAYYCDGVGFQKVDFDEFQTQKPDNLMRIVYVEPHKTPYISEIENSLKAKQKAVGGLIETIYNDDGTCLVGNDESKLIGMDGNRYLDDGNSIIAGPFFVCGLTEDSFRGLTDEEVVKYMDKFAEPQDISPEEVEADTGFTFYTGM